MQETVPVEIVEVRLSTETVTRLGMQIGLVVVLLLVGVGSLVGLAVYLLTQL